MIHVVLDTNIYRKNPARDNLQFKALEKLSKAGFLCLHIPYVVLREYQSQQRELHSTDLEKAISGLSNLIRKTLNKDISDDLNTTKSDLEKKKENILSSAENQIVKWANSIGANIIPLCKQQAHLAFEAYFKGTAPLKSLKNREDIPDSFIVQSILKLHNDHKQTYVIAEDKKVREAFTSSENINTYESLSEFIENDLIQNELIEVDLIDNIDSLTTILERNEKDSANIQNFISDNIGEFIAWSAFYDSTIPDDNHEATITGYYDAENIKLDFPEISYYGNGQFGIPFSLKITVQALYYIFKSDYYSIDPEIRRLPSVSDHNDHYFEAEEEFQLSVSGLVSITLNTNDISFDNLPESIKINDLEIDEISSITVC